LAKQKTQKKNGHAPFKQQQGTILFLSQSGLSFQSQAQTMIQLIQNQNQTGFRNRLFTASRIIAPKVVHIFYPIFLI